MKFSFFTSAFLSVVLLGSCAVEVDTPANEDEKMYLEAWIHTHHPDAERQGMGIYVLSETEGDGEKSITMPCYAMVTYTTRDLDGNVTATSDSTMAKLRARIDRDPESTIQYRVKNKVGKEVVIAQTGMSGAYLGCIVIEPQN